MWRLRPPKWERQTFKIFSMIYKLEVLLKSSGNRKMMVPVSDIKRCKRVHLRRIEGMLNITNIVIPDS